MGFTGFADFNFNYNTSSDLADSTFTVLHNRRGLHDVFSIVWNVWSVEIITASFLTVEAYVVTDISLTSSTALIITNDDITFMLRASGGYGATCVVDYDDGTTSEYYLSYMQYLNSFPDQDPNVTVHLNGPWEHNLTKSYSAGGVYIVTVSCNGNSTITLDSKTVKVVQPIVGFR